MVPCGGADAKAEAQDAVRWCTGIDAPQKGARRQEEPAPHLEVGRHDGTEAGKRSDHAFGLMVVAGLAVGEQQGFEGTGAQETSRAGGLAGWLAPVGQAGLESTTRP